MPRPRPAAAVRAERLRIAVIAAALALATTLAYQDSFRAPFLVDDGPNIKASKAIRPPLSLSKWMETQRPVVAATLSLDYAIGELDVTSYHVTNLVLHLVCGLVLFGFTRHLLGVSRVRDRYGGAATPIAAAATALFLLHPIQTESVTYLIQRSEILASIGLLGALWGASAAAQRGLGAREGVAIGACAALGTLSKPSLAILPLLFLLYDACLLGGTRLAALRPRAPLYALLAGVGVLSALVAWQQIGEGESRSAGFQLPSVSPWQYLRWQLGVLPYYLRLVVWPDRLCFDCGLGGPWPVVTSILGERLWLHALLVAALAGLAFALRRRLPIATFALVGSAIVLAPTSSFVPLLDAYVEHRLYLPIGLLAILAACAGSDLVRSATLRFRLGPWQARALGIGLSALACLALGWRTFERNRAYADPAVLYEQSIAIAPQNERSGYDLANLYWRRGDSELAVARFEANIRRHPRAVRSYVNLGALYMDGGDPGRAVPLWEQAAEIAPSLALVQWNLANAYLELGERERALAAAERAVALAPRDGRALDALGKARAARASLAR